MLRQKAKQQFLHQLERPLKSKWRFAYVYDKWQTGDNEKIELTADEYLDSVSETLGEWLSPEDEEAWRDL